MDDDADADTCNCFCCCSHIYGDGRTANASIIFDILDI